MVEGLIPPGVAGLADQITRRFGKPIWLQDNFVPLQVPVRLKSSTGSARRLRKNVSTSRESVSAVAVRSLDAVRNYGKRSSALTLIVTSFHSGSARRIN